MDTFTEILVRRKTTVKDIALVVVVVLSAVLIAGLALLLIPVLYQFASLLLLLAVGAGVGAWFLATATRVEYEYILTNGELDVDQITAKRKRKRLISVSCSKFEEMAPYEPQKLAARRFQTKLFACDSVGGENVWYAVFRHQNAGTTLLVFNMSERLMKGMQGFLPKEIQHEINLRHRPGATETN